MSTNEAIINDFSIKLLFSFATLHCLYTSLVVPRRWFLYMYCTSMDAMDNFAMSDKKQKCFFTQFAWRRNGNSAWCDYVCSLVQRTPINWIHFWHCCCLRELLLSFAKASERESKKAIPLFFPFFFLYYYLIYNNSFSILFLFLFTSISISVFLLCFVRLFLFRFVY